MGMGQEWEWSAWEWELRRGSGENTAYTVTHRCKKTFKKE